LIKDNLANYWRTILFGVFLISCGIAITYVDDFKQTIIFETLFLGILLSLGSIFKPEKPKKTTVKKENLLLQLSPEKRIDVYLERYRQSWNETRTIHEIQWKCVTVTTTVAAAILGLLVYVKWDDLILTALAPLVIGLLITIKDRDPFLNHIMIIARIEKLLRLHEDFPQLPDNSLLPSEYTEISEKTYEEYKKQQKWKIKSGFVGLVVIYILYAIAILVLWIFLRFSII
jgi:hypothetical protein